MSLEVACDGAHVCVCGSVQLTASDANWGSTGCCKGHLRTAVIVKFSHPRPAHHSTVGVRPSVCLSVPETPDVTLWTDRK